MYCDYGLMSSIQKNIKNKHSQQHFSNNIEILQTDFEINNFAITLLNLYSPPNINVSSIIDILHNGLHYTQLQNNLLIVGDFIINMEENNKTTNKLETFLNSKNIHFLLDKNKLLQQSLIDHAWSNIKKKFYKIYKRDTYSTDHDCICLLLDLAKKNDIINVSNYTFYALLTI